MSPDDQPFVAVDRERWARLAAAGDGRAPGAVPPAGAAATEAPADPASWAGDGEVDARERVEVLAPLAALAARRREQDLDGRAGLGALDDALVRGGASARGWVVAVAGGVAAGKSTVARALVAELRARGIGPVEHVSTDGYLHSNAELERRGLTARKGFPESYDVPALRALLQAVRAGDGTLEVPVYSHRLQDREPEPRTIDRPAVLVLEGLRALAGPGPDGDPGVRDLVDLGVYVDATEDAARAWYLDRFHAWRVAAADDPGALLHQIADMPDADADALALRVWAETNAPNVRDHVLPTRAHADVILEKDADHRVARVLVRPV
ncbi:type I pantothenate kinase [Patulibacter sp. NPDC049589]|uniref:type I pantothenate kinase n=1 Tax=Patulibacter sp. NPDC049589 TaxID=3154731 RepID=UPI00343CBECD